ncbi:hypothetical protein MMC18_003456 [Xylographa bjoerkii]|nr:hypothetical protein [Xylographa bjoerkii]
MLSYWVQAWSLAILTLNVTRTAAINWDSVGTAIESGPKSVASSIDGGLSQLAGDLRGDFDDFEQAVESELSKALANNDGVLAQFTMAHQTTPPISTQLMTSGLQSNVTIGLYCANCSNASQPTAFDFASQNYSGWESSWLGFALDSFDALFEVEIDLSADASGDLTLSLLKKSAESDGVVVEVDFQLYLVADASASMSFTAGLNLTLTEPAAIMMPALDPVLKLNESQRIGFAQDSFILAPIFNASMPQLDFSVQLSLRTVFSVTVEDINVGALYLDLPAFNLTVNTLTNAMSDCQTPPAGTPTDEIYTELIHLNGALVAELSYEIFDGGSTGIIEKWTIWNALDKCYAFLPGLGSIGVVPDSPQSPLLTAPPLTSCTAGGRTNLTGTVSIGTAIQSLSPGAIAGAGIGTLAGVVLIATLAWYSGRANLRHSIKNGGTGLVWPTSCPRSYKFFSRNNRRGATEFSPLPPSTSAWQSSAYGGGFSPSLDAEIQQQFEQQRWQKAEKATVVTTTEAVSPAPTYISIGDDYGVPTPRARETDGIRDNTGSRPTMYEGFRTGQAEGLGLLQGGPRPVVQRKSAPGHGNASRRL